MPTRPYLVLANAAAGSTERDAVALAVSRLAEHAPTRVVWTDDIAGFRDAVETGAGDDQVVIAGGDGSIHLALETVVDLGRCDDPIGIVPLGTGNDFARNHAIPLEPDAAAEVIVAGAHRVLPAIELRGRDRATVVANNVHFGLGVDAARRAQAWKPVAGRFAYPIATAYQGAAGAATPMRVVADGAEIWDGPALAVLVLLGPSMGGGVEVVPEQPEPGIDLVVVGPAEVADRVDLVRRIRNGTIEQHPAVTRAQVSTCTITGAACADLDGELADVGPEVDLRYLPEAWRVLLPA